MEKALGFQYVDAVVTRKKFDEEVHKYKSAVDYYRRLGVLLLEEAFPNLYFGFAAPGVRPIPFVFGVRVNFDNFDIQPLSVQFVHPLTFEPLLADQMPNLLPRKLEGALEAQMLLQFQDDKVPFFCIPGVREYHDHPYHTGDSWFLYRGRGNEGSLCFILDNLQLYGTSHVKAYFLALQLNMPNLTLVSDSNLIPL